MAVLQRVAFYPNERFDTPDARSLEGFGLNDWRYFLMGVMSDKSYVLKGFDITNYATAFAVVGFKLKANNVVMFHPESTRQAAGFYVYAGSEPDISVTLSPNATNFIEADFTTESGTPDVRAFWDQAANPPTGSEFTDTVDTVINLEVLVTSNVSGFTSGKVPLYKVTTDINGIATSITDCRNLFFRLGKGGTTPDPDYTFAWPALPDAGHAQFETASTSTSYSTVNAPWQGGDKNLENFKDWMDAIMSSIKEIKGVPYWYMAGGGGAGIGITGAYQNSALTVLQNGQWQHLAGNVGHLALAAGSKLVRMGFANDPVLASFTDVDLTTNKAFYIILPKGDTAVTFGMGENGTSPVSPQDTTAVSATSVSVAVGGNYEVSGGRLMIRGQEFEYVSYTPGTGLFSGVTPDPSGLVEVGDTVYALDEAGVGYYHHSTTAKVPSVTSPNISEGAERTIWLAVYNGVDTINLHNGEIIEGEQIDVGDNTSKNVLAYIGSPSDAATMPLYAATTHADALDNQQNYSASVGENLTVRLSKVTQMVADKAQDKTIRLLRQNIDTIVNTTNGTNQEITMTGTSPAIHVVMPTSGNNGVINCTGTLSLQANETAYFLIDRNNAFTVGSLDDLIVVANEDVPVGENVYIFAYRLSTSRVYLYDGRSFAVGSYPGEYQFNMTVRDRLGVQETSFDAYTSTTVVEPTDSYPEAISKLDVLVGAMASDTAIEENIYATLNQTAFSFSTLLFSPLNSSYDVKIYRNGRKMGQDPAGTLTEDYRKTGVASIEFAYGLRPNDKVTARMERQLNVTLSSQPYFVNYVDNTNLATVSVGAQYNTGTNKLTPYLNGVLLYNSPSIGNPADRYQEAGSLAITLGQAIATTDVVTFVNEDTTPTAKQFVTGLTGSTLTVPTYTLGDGSLRVYRNGVLMNNAGLGTSTEKYAEATTTTITLTDASLITDVWCFHVMGQAPDFIEHIDGVAGPVLTLTNTYTMGDERLLVFKNGVLLHNSTTLGNAADRYQETGTSEITLEDAAAPSDVFTFIYK